MANINRPNTFTPNSTISSSQVNDDFDTIYSEFNGNISSANLADNAVTTAKIADDAVTSAKIANNTITADNLSTAVAQGYYDLGDTPDTVTYNGNRSYDLVFNSNDLTDTVSNGMRVKLARTVTPPTQCTDLEAGSSQYWSKTSPAGTTFTDDFCAGAWIKLESYGTTMTIVSRYNGTSGWIFRIMGDGTVELGGYNAGSGNVSKVISYQSVPLNKWVHVTAQLDMSAFTATTTTSYVMIDGVNVPAYVSRGGTNPTALVQAGNLEIGAFNATAGSYFDGKLAQVWYSSAKITQSTIQTFISQGMTGSETSIVSHFDFNGDGNDNNANANNLTANAGATATTVDSPFNATEYGIITANSFSTNTTLTVQVPEGYAIPTSGGVSSVFYSTQDVPYGFPRDRGKWTIETLIRGSTTGLTIGGTDVWQGSNNFALTVPIGNWKIIHQSTYIQRTTVARTIEAMFTLKNSTYLPTTNAIYNHPLAFVIYTHASVAAALGNGYNSTNISLPAQATFTPSVQIPTSSGSETWEAVGARGPIAYTAEFNYV